MQHEISPFAKFLANGQTTLTSGATAVAVGSSKSRRSLYFKNMSTTATIYFGNASTVTDSTGVPVGPGQDLSLFANWDCAMYLYNTSGGDVKIAWAEFL